MDQESIVYGCIKDVPMAPELDQRKRRMVNRSALLDLPVAFEKRIPFSLCGYVCIAGSGYFHWLLPHTSHSLWARLIVQWNTSGNYGCVSLKSFYKKCIG